MKPQQHSDNKYLFIVAVGFIALITFFLYTPALNHNFVNWDDDINVYANIYIRNIDSDFLKWAFSTKFAGLWHPLTMFSYAINYSLFGLNPFGYHLTNIALHVLNATILFFVITKLIEQTPLHKNTLIVATVTALIFGIHPIHVESVAWITERKGLLCAFFYLLTLLSYFKYIDSNTRGKRSAFYTLSSFFYTLALMSKPMAVSLPVVILLLDFYPFKRLFLEKKIALHVLIEKIPFFILTIGFSLITVAAQNKAGALPSLDFYPLHLRIMNAVHSYIAYIAKMVLPINFAPYYPFPFKLTVFEPLFIFYAITFIAITLLTLLALKNNRPFIFTIWSYYIITLLPVIGIIKVGGFAMADRYSYLPSIATFLLIGISVGAVLNSDRIRRIWVISLLIVISGVLMSITHRQIGVWKDSITLWSHQIKIFPTEVAIPYNNRGIAYDDKGDYLNAIKDYTMAITLDPKVVLSYNNRANDYARLGSYRMAIDDYNTIIKVDPKYTNAYSNRGNAYFSSGNFHDALKDYTLAINLDGSYTEAYYNRCNVHLRLGNYKDALKDCDMAITLDPKLSLAYYNLGIINSMLGNNEKAAENFNISNRLKAKYGDVYYTNTN